MIFGYLRVSTKEQNVDRQINEITKYVDYKNLYIDKASGANFERPEYQALKNKVRPGDVVYFKELDRLGRNKRQMKSELEFFKNNDVIVKFLDIPTTLMNLDEFGEMQKSIMDMVNNILIEVLSTQAESEYKKIKARQKEGIAIAKQQGKYIKCGRPQSEIFKDPNFSLLYEQWKIGNLKITNFSKLMGCSRPTIYKNIKYYEKNKNV